MRKHAYGQRPPDIGDKTFGLGWLSGVRHIVYHAAKPSHWHVHPELSLLFCLRGECTYEFRDHKPITLSAGSCLAFPRGLVHRHMQAIDPVGIRLEMLLVPEKTSSGRYGVLPEKLAKSSIGNIFSPPVTAKSCPRQVLSAVKELDALATMGEKKLGPIEIARARILATTILLGCAHELPTSNYQLPAADHHLLMDEITAWMEKHISEKLDIDRLVAHIGYSRTHVFTLFKKRTGLTPADYLTRLRVRKARELLKTTDLTSKDVAATCGFSSPSIFNTVFKRLTGVTPIKWRHSSGS